MQIQILDDSGAEWATLSRRYLDRRASSWVDSDGDLLNDRYQQALDELEATVEADPYWAISVNRGRP